jgi:hypothetical protein
MQFLVLKKASELQDDRHQRFFVDDFFEKMADKKFIELLRSLVLNQVFFHKNRIIKREMLQKNPCNIDIPVDLGDFCAVGQYNAMVNNLKRIGHKVDISYSRTLKKKFRLVNLVINLIFSKKLNSRKSIVRYRIFGVRIVKKILEDCSIYIFNQKR